MDRRLSSQLAVLVLAGGCSFIDDFGAFRFEDAGTDASVEAPDGGDASTPAPDADVDAGDRDGGSADGGSDAGTARCDDDTQNGEETGVDCGGPCAPCWNLVEATAGSYHTCARNGDGAVFCWGNNARGGLGHDAMLGSEIAALPPRAVEGPRGQGLLVGAIGIAAGSSFTCAWMNDGAALCWGSDFLARLGNRPEGPLYRPAPVPGIDGEAELGNVVQLAAGDSHACALLGTGRVACWGDANNGRLGNGSMDGAQVAPAEVLSVSGAGRLENVTQISVSGSHSCARQSDGRAVCWGSNSRGQLGNGTTDDASRPVVVTDTTPGPLSGVDEIAAGGRHSCARRAGAVRCWGDNARRQLGNSSTTSALETRAAPDVQRLGGPRGGGTLYGARQLSLGFGHSCAWRMADDEISCWGEDSAGQVGRGGDGGSANIGETVVGLSGEDALNDVVSVAAGSNHACAVQRDGQLACWGSNNLGQLGNQDAMPGIPTLVTPAR